jgi:two-component system LytT family sensor kinase
LGEDTESMELPNLEPSRYLPVAKRWWWMGSLWLGLGILNATQTVVGMRSEGMQHAWGRLFFMLVLSWLIWLPATPLIQWLGNRFPPIHWHPISTWLIHLAACTGIGLTYSLWTAWLREVLHPWGDSVKHASVPAVAVDVFCYEYHLFLILYAAILTIYYYLDSRKRLALRETEAARLNEELSKAQLNALRHQLEPHFLFNTLNAIAGLVRESRNGDAVNMIVGLSDLLRRVLEGSARQEVALGEEMELLEKYLDIQKMRFADRLQVAVDIPGELLAVQVPSLILQPMVENAIQHGIGRRVEGGVIRITASRVDGRLTLNIYNNGPSLPEGWQQSNAGIGIANVRTRLRGLYGSSCVLDIRNHQIGGVEVLLSFPGRTCSP